MKGKVTVVALMAILGGGPCLAIEGSSPTIRYEVDASLNYLSEGIRGFSASNIAKLSEVLALSTTSNSGKTRSLGLTRLRTAFHLRLVNSSEFTFVLRPDALSRLPDTSTGERQVVRDFDGRAGDVYRDAAEVKFLDAYQLHLLAGSNVRVSLGVFEEIAPLMAVYRNPLEFGLITKLAEKFFAVRLGWKHTDLSLPTAQEMTRSGFSYELWGYQAHQDRVEEFAYGSRTYDLAPTARDPYVGTSVALHWADANRLKISSRLGYGTSRRSDSRIEELWTALGVRSKSHAGHIPVDLSVEYRALQEVWTFSDDHLPRLHQQSLALGSSWAVSTHGRVLVGGSLGQSERHASDESRDRHTFSGWQVETGYQHEIARQLDLAIIYAYETRKVDGTENEYGGFSLAKPQTKKVNRLAVSFNYHLGASI